MKHFLQSMKMNGAKSLLQLCIILLVSFSPLFAQQPGNALNFDGSNDRVSLPNNLVTAATASSNTAITIEYWFRGSNPQSAVRLQNGSNFIIAGWGGSVGSQTHIISSDGGSGNGISMGTGINDGRWHHIAMTWQRNTTNGFKSYLDGQLVAQRNSANVALPVVTANAFIGSFNGSSEFTNGSLDEVKIFTTSRTQAEIQADMFDISANTPAGMLAYYKFNQGAAGSSNTSITTLNDQTSNAYNGTLLGFGLTASTSNWVESYAAVLPRNLNASTITSNGFTVNFQAPVNGTVNSYVLEVFTNPLLSNPVLGSPFTLASTELTKSISGLLPGTYYFRVRAEKSSVSGHGEFTEIATVNIPFSAPGNTLAFDGSNDHVVLPDGLLSSVQNLTIETWFIINDNSTWQRVFDFGSGTAKYILFTPSPGRGTANSGLFEIYNGSSVQELTSKTVFQTGKWYHLAVTLNDSTNTGKLYINGVLEDENNAVTIKPSDLGNTTQNFLGRSQYSDPYLNGRIDELRIWNIVRSQEQIRANLNKQIDPNTSGLINYYQFNQGIAGSINTGLTQLIDSKSSNGNGSLVNFGLTLSTGSNWLESYALMIPNLLATSDITGTSFTINWEAPPVGIVTGYYIDVSTNEAFTAPISGSPFFVSGSSTLFRNITGLQTNLNYYYRIRADKSSLTGTGAYSNPQQVRTLNVFNPPGNCLAFDGSQDVVSVSNMPMGHIANFTMEAWINPATLSITNQTLFSYGFDNGSSGNGISLNIDPTGNLKIHHSGVVHVNSGYVFPIANRWYHVAVTRENGVTKAYVNGEQTPVTVTNNPYTPTAFLIGANNGFRFYNGKMDEFRFYNQALSAEQIKADMSDTVSVLPGNLIAYYNFDQGTPSGTNTGINILTDISGNNKNASLLNFALSGTNSNWIRSNAMVRPLILPATNITSSGFTANWDRPLFNNANSYILDISTNPQFTGLVGGSPISLDSITYTKVITDLISGTYYYRVRSQTAGISNQESVSETASALIKYTPPGNALSMDGSNDLLAIDNATGINNRFADNKITLETWFLLKALPNAGQMPALITENYNGAGGYNILFAIYLHQNKIWGGFHNGSWTAANVEYSFEVNKWYHAACTYDKNIIKLYVNGVLIATKTSTLALPKGSEDWSIGRRWDYNEFINGNFDEVKIYNAALTQEEINLDMRDTGLVLPNKIVAYYNFDQGVAAANNTHISTILDQSPSAYHANLTNSALTGATSNIIESYAIAVPKALEATSISSTGFTANWEFVRIGEVSNYLIEVSTSKDFTGLIAPAYVMSNTTTSRVFSNMVAGTYYYRVRANNTKTNINQQGAYSAVIKVDVPYTPPGNAMSFDGINDRLKLRNASIGNFGTSNFTIEFWMKANSTHSYLISKRDQCGHGSFFVIGHYNGQITLEMDQDIWANNYVVKNGNNPNTNVSDGKWHHVAVVRAGVNWKIYVDGIITLNHNASGITSISNGNSIDIGTRYCHNLPFNGSMDELRIWNSARTQEQITASMKNTMDPNAIGLKLYYNFDQGVGGALNYDYTEIYDQSPSKVDAYTIDMELEALNTNFVQSYAMVVPTQLEPTDITPNGFKLNWTAPSVGIVTNYLVDVSLSANFTAPISGSPFNVSGGQTSLTIDGLAPSTFYCRIRANQTGKPYSNEGAPSNVKTVKLEYTPPGNALKFDGTNDYATIPRPISGDFTIEYWMKTNQVGYSGHITGTGVVDMEVGGAPGDYRNALVGDKITFGLGSNGQDPTLFSNTSVNNGKWYHIAMTRDKSTGQIRLYVNGNLEANGSSGTGNITASSLITLGSVNTARGSSTRSFNGTIDELRIWDVVRTPAEIGEYFKDTIDRNTPGLLAYYNFDQGIADGSNSGVTTLADIAGADNGGTLTNFALNGVNSNWVKTYNISVASPTNLTTSTNLCSRIELNWQLGTTNPTSNCEVSVFCDNDHFKQFVYADDELIAIYPFNTTSCSFNVNQTYNGVKLIRGVDYKFSVRTAYAPPLFKYVQTSAPSNISVGRFKPNPEPPSGFTATTNKCDGSVDLGWSWFDVNPANGFVFNRSTDSAMTNPVVTTLSGTTRSYTDAGLQRGQYYYYRIFARNDCYVPNAHDTMFAGVSDTITMIGGLSPTVPNRPSNIRLFSDSVNNVITIRWNDNSDFEEKYSVERTAVGGGTSSFEVNANDTVYLDEQAAACVNYNYSIKVYSGCALSGISSLGLNQTRLTPNLANTFEPGTIYKLKCSKGYFPDRVELNWNNRNNGQLTTIRIYRKVASSTNDSILINSVLAGSGLYVDNTTVAGVMYRYYLIGETQCAGVTRFSNIASDLGFRSPSGVVNGTISYQGGYAVEGARVLVQNTSAYQGGALQFDGVNDYVEIPHQASQNPSNNAITIEAWYKPLMRKSFVIASKMDSLTGGYLLMYDSANNRIEFTIASAVDQQTVYVENPFESFTSYNQITATYGTDSIRIYINGIEGKTVMTTNTGLGASSGPIYLGSDPNLGIYGYGNMDEVRLWSIAKSKSQIIRDFNRTSGSNNANLFLYLTFDDRFPGLTETFDQSNLNLVFKENHGNLMNGCTFSDSIPTSSQLALANYSDKNGGYTIENIRYLGTGQNFLVVPTLDVHTFAPNNKVIFLGDGSQVLNNVDFLDNSSFEFVGRVNYAGTTCPASGAAVLIDNQFVVQNGAIVTSNDSGKFVVRVPIGEHFVSLNQLNHTFSQGRFPPTGTYNFNGPANANFVDSTLLKVVGRVVGGLRELNKVPGLGRSRNNIGKAQFNLSTVGQAGINDCFTRQIVTNDSTGEYEAYLFPLRYTISNLRLVNNPDPTLLTAASLNNPNILDLTAVQPPTTVRDTFKTAAFTRVDSTTFNTRMDFKYFVPPVIYVTDLNTKFDSLVNNFGGETSLQINDSITVPLAQNPFGYPVFQQGKEYTGLVKVVEIYSNADKLESDTLKYDKVPVAGTLAFFNDLATSDDTIRQVSLNDGAYIYTFKAGAPNELRNSLNPNYSYTKTFQIQFAPSVGATVAYAPNSTDLVSPFYRAIILGSRPTGTSFTTTGPSLVDFVLRDPPGSASSATWTTSKSFTSVESWGFTDSYGRAISNETDLGSKVVNFVGLGAGVITETEVKANFTLGFSMNLSRTREGEIVKTTTTTTSISTGSDPGSVGAGADIYYGKASNILFGNSHVIELIDTATCAILDAQAGSSVCIGTPVNGYKIGKRTGYFIVPGDVKTTFAYTQDEILTLIIPELEGLRNSLLTSTVLNSRGQQKYLAVFNDQSDPQYAQKFASNNDDPIWGGLRSTSTPFDREQRDSIGASYHFRGNTPMETDSIRYYNNQIRLWKSAIARNEREKFIALSGSSSTSPGGSNLSLGKAAFSQEFSSQLDRTSTESIELNFSEELSTVFGWEFNETGQEMTNTVSFEQTKGSSRSSTNSYSNTFAYTLQDGDDGDLISVDVVDPKSGNGHVFRLKAGRTSCPYEGEQRSMFFDPSNDTITSSTLLEEGVLIQPSTAQNDLPKINVQQKNIYNVPADDAAVFVLELGNLSEGHQDRTYSLRVNQASNPYGAIIKVDGLDPNRDFDVPYGTTLQKTLTLERGPINYDYNNIQLIFKSSCDDDIFDTISISARFLPTCTGVTIKSPDDRWVVNNSFNDTLPILIGGYNYNYGGFKAVHFQYKPAAGNVWYTEKTFFRDTPDVNNMIPIGTPDIYYPFNMRNLPDGKYELRAVTECIAPGYPNSRINSTVLQGTVDRVNPSPFGNPSPADGILSPNDEISIKFNETIDQSTLSLSNFEVKGVLNKTNLRSNSSLYLDGDNDYAEVPVGLNLQRAPFTIELWHKRGKLGHYVLASQGADTAANFELGYTADNKLYFKVGEEMVTSNLPLTDTTSFNFIAVAYNADIQVADLYLNNFVVNIGNNRIFNPYESSGKFYIGKASSNTPDYAKGNIYEMRIWSSYRTLTEANNTKSILLNGTESGLIANWKMDEASGTELKDYARSRNANIVNAQWMMSPRGHAYGFGGNGFITVPTNTFGLSKEMDFTLEFWFKSNAGNQVCLLSNGKGDSSDANPNLKWSIETDAQGRILLKHNNRTFQATNTSFFDGNWHHFAMVMKRSSSLSAYIDGNLQNSSQAINFEQFGGGKLWVGSRGWNNYALPIFDSTDMPFTGSIDELRIWQTSRLLEQIRRDKNNRLNGNESGLVLYVPFESYTEVMGFPILTSSPVDLVSGGTSSFTTVGTSSFNQESPTIKLPRPVQDINFSYSVNNDEIIITPTTSNEFIENVTLDITVKNIKDLHGNTMQSPKTWIAFMDRNQVKWQDDYRSFTKQSLAPMTFTAKIINSGGALKEFNLGNMPSWLRAQPATGMISPNTSQDIVFTIDQNLNIGSYEADLALNTDFGFADKLLVKLKVNGTAPVWNVDPSLYTKSMSIIGQVRINNVISSNSDDILAAFVGEQCRGFAKVTYYEQLDKYLVFMDVYGINENEQLEFRIWNSATGKTHVDVLPALQFQTNTLVGNVLAPQVFNALDKVNQTIVVKPGWNWISFNLLTPDSNNLGNLFKTVSLSNGAVLKNNDQLAIYDQTQGWTGNLANFNMGMKPEHSYLFYTHAEDTIIVKGVEANPLLRPISINQGWNYIGYVGQRNLNVNDAFGSFGSKQNDLIKGQVQFAVYDSTLGWIGSLTTLVPGRGYQYYANGTGILKYPRSAMFGKSTNDNTISSKYWKINPHGFENNMNLIIKVDACNEILKSGNLLLGAFVNNELRGFTKATAINANQYGYFLTVAGRSGEQVQFKLLNESNGELFPIAAEIKFEANALKGALSAPIVMSSSKELPCEDFSSLSAQLEISLYPVPSKETVSLRISQANDANVQINIFDLSGKLIDGKSMGQMKKGIHEVNLSLDAIAEGVYIVEVVSGNESQRSKLIRIH